MDTITVEKRNGKAKGKQLRRAGIIPCCVYGGGLEESLSIQMDVRTASKLLREKREGSKVKLQVDEQVIPVQIKDKTWDFESNGPVHISFQALKAEQKVNSVAHIILKNTDKVGGLLEKMLLEIPYASLPKYMIDTVTVDLDGLAIGTVLTVGDISEFKSENIELQVEEETILFRISEKKFTGTQEAE